MKDWIVVSFYTEGTGYEQEIQKLKASLIKFNLPYKFFPCSPVGTWRGNLNYKSMIILKSFDLFPDKDIVFIDADGIVRQYPSLFDVLSKEAKHDIAAHFHPYMGTNISGGSLLSGTLWLQNSEKGKKLIQKWHEIGKKHLNIRHQHCLRLAINELNTNGMKIRVYRLPREYTLIFDYYKGKNRPEPVIEHFQKSRQLRREVGFGKRLLNSSFSTVQEKKKGYIGSIFFRRTNKYKKQILTTQNVGKIIKQWISQNHDKKIEIKK